MKKTEKPVIVGMFACGKRQGKTYMANRLKDRYEKEGHKVKVVSFASAIRSIAKDVLREFGVGPEDADRLLTEDKDERVLGLSTGPGLWPAKLVSPRDGLLVGIGQAVRKYVSRDAWITALHTEINALSEIGFTHIIIDDVRKPDEARAICKWGGRLAYVKHPHNAADERHEDYEHAETIAAENGYTFAAWLAAGTVSWSLRAAGL